MQRRIAGILSAYDELMENSQRRIRILEAMARALYREWFVHFRFPGHEKLPRVASPLGDIPQGWEVKTLGELRTVSNSRHSSPRANLTTTAIRWSLTSMLRDQLLDARTQHSDNRTQSARDKRRIDARRRADYARSAHRHTSDVLPSLPDWALCTADTSVIRRSSPR